MPLCPARCVLQAVDILLSCLIILPLTVLYWSGTWKLCDFYLIPDNALYSALLSLAIGSFLGLMGYFLLPILKEIVSEECSLQHVLISRTFLYVYVFGSLSYWRGVWNLMNMLLQKRLLWSVVALVTAEMALLAIRASCNTLSSPFVILLDTREEFYQTYPRFRQQVGRLCCYSLDSLFTLFVVLTLVIQVWCGWWNILDLLLFPDNKLRSYYVCLAVGMPLAVLYLALQWPMHEVAHRMQSSSPLAALLFEDTLKLVATVTTLLIWRGAWGLMRDYIIKNSTWQAWTYHSAGMLGLLVLQTCSTLDMVGCAVDSEGNLDSYVSSVQYTLTWWQHWHRPHDNGQIQVEESTVITPDEHSSLLGNRPSVGYTDVLVR